MRVAMATRYAPKQIIVWLRPRVLPVLWFADVRVLAFPDAFWQSQWRSEDHDRLQYMQAPGLSIVTRCKSNRILQFSLSRKL